MIKFLQFLNRICSKTEERIGLWFASWVIGFLVLLVASLYVMPHYTLSYHGMGYAELSQRPFDFLYDNPLRYRILTPFLAWLCKVPAHLFFIVPWLFAALLLGAIYGVYRKREFSHLEALAMASLVAFSATIFIPMYAAGYTDIVSYFFIFLCFVFVSNPYILSAFLCAAMFNHECVFFLLPGLMAYSLQLQGTGTRKIFSFLFSVSAALVPYALYRFYVDHYTEPLYDLSFYLSLDHINQTIRAVARLTPAGAFYAFKLFWFLPLVVLYGLSKRVKIAELLPILLIIGGTGLQLLFAYDITRLFALAFMAILLSAERIRGLYPDQFSKGIWLLIGFNFFIPQYFVSQEGLNDLFPPVIYLIEYLIEG